MNKSKVSLYPILAVNFVGSLGFSIVLPFLIFLVTRFGGNSVIYGLMGATYSIFQLIGAPVLGNWSDQYGRRKILLLSQLGTLISWVIFLTAMFLPTDRISEINSELLGTFFLTIPLLVLFFARALDGITGGNISVANAYLADITSEEKRSENFGKMAVSANLGFIFGPAIAGLLGATALQEKLPVLAAIFISVIALIIIWFYLPESKTETISRNPEKTNVRKVLGQDQKECFKIECKNKLSFWEIARLDRVNYILLLYFLVYLGFNFFYIAFPFHAVEQLNWELTETGIFFSFLSVMMVLFQGPVLAKMSKKYNEAKLVLWGSPLLGVSFMFFISSDIIAVYSGAFLLAAGNGIMWASLLAFLSKVAPDKFQGAIQGFAGSLGSAASIIGLLLGGFLYEKIGVTVFVISGIIILAVFLMSFRLSKLK